MNVHRPERSTTSWINLTFLSFTSLIYLQFYRHDDSLIYQASMMSSVMHGFSSDLKTKWCLLIPSAQVYNQNKEDKQQKETMFRDV